MKWKSYFHYTRYGYIGLSLPLVCLCGTIIALRYGAFSTENDTAFAGFIVIASGLGVMLFALVILLKSYEWLIKTYYPHLAERAGIE